MVAVNECRTVEMGGTEMMNLELMDYGVLRRVSTEVVYLQVTRSQCRRASNASAMFVLMTSCESLCVRTLKSRDICNSKIQILACVERIQAVEGTGMNLLLAAGGPSWVTLKCTYPLRVSLPRRSPFKGFVGRPTRTAWSCARETPVRGLASASLPQIANLQLTPWCYALRAHHYAQHHHISPSAPTLPLHHGILAGIR
jgi:hypothetical protein